MDGNEVVKNLLVTMVGENCSGIKKARSAAHRGEFGDYVMEFIPLSCAFVEVFASCIPSLSCS